MSEESGNAVTPRNQYVRLLEAVRVFLYPPHMCPSPRDWVELKSAYESITEDPQLDLFASGQYDRVTMLVPRGYQITILGPAPVGT